ncbi:hypothetical protein WG70_11905 [Burkholderia oklahomensis EO147]|nr:hypothetical protein WG70_11905 [Burkholderia oklahomensis EO147]AOI50319.1 hypothetical protein WI23_29650 [Burkholderia oklahomensis C6786]KUY47336.1 hypothetical protein WI23_30105 [Burkholderia oklahomensis C6786]KUY48823.1 hypothetical protein WG70_21845 [Burkholderia oklahomensis EO147]
MRRAFRMWPTRSTQPTQPMRRTIRMPLMRSHEREASMKERIKTKKTRRMRHGPIARPRRVA